MISIMTYRELPVYSFERRCEWAGSDVAFRATRISVASQHLYITSPIKGDWLRVS